MGRVGGEIFKIFPDAWGYDPGHEFCSMTKKELKKKRFDVAFICVPTPSSHRGKCDISNVDKVVEMVNANLIIIRSTVKPGTTYELAFKYRKRLVFMPEYIGESEYKNPIMKTEGDMPFFIFGGDVGPTQQAVDLFQPIFGPLVKYIQCSFSEAELAKYFENTFFAVKVGLVNEFADISKAHGVDWDVVRELWLLDPRINRMHTSVFKNKRGFSGKCLPKDLKAIIHSSKELGYKPEILMKVDKENNKRQ